MNPNKRRRRCAIARWVKQRHEDYEADPLSIVLTYTQWCHPFMRQREAWRLDL